MHSLNISPLPILPPTPNPYSIFSIRTVGTPFTQSTLRLILQLLASRFTIQQYKLEGDLAVFVIINLSRTEIKRLENTLDFIRYKLLTSVDEFALLSEIRKELTMGDTEC